MLLFDPRDVAGYNPGVSLAIVALADAALAVLDWWLDLPRRSSISIQTSGHDVPRSPQPSAGTATKCTSLRVRPLASGARPTKTTSAIGKPCAGRENTLCRLSR